jgi:hypothetical protein
MATGKTSGESICGAAQQDEGSRRLQWQHLYGIATTQIPASSGRSIKQFARLIEPECQSPAPS